MWNNEGIVYGVVRRTPTGFTDKANDAYIAVFDLAPPHDDQNLILNAVTSTLPERGSFTNKLSQLLEADIAVCRQLGKQQFVGYDMIHCRVQREYAGTTKAAHTKGTAN